MADEFKIDPQKVLIESQGGWAGSAGDWTWAFGRSALESIPELIGIEPSEGTLNWRANNPWSGLASELVGMAVPYTGWMRAARGIKGLETVAKGIEASKLERPFLSMAGAEAVRLAPFEIGRVGVSQIVGDKPLGEMALDAGLNLTLGAGLAGGIGVIGAAGSKVRGLADVVPGIEATAPPQLLLRQLDELAPRARPEDAEQLFGFSSKLDNMARAETAPRYVSKEVAGQKDELEKLFRPTSEPGTVLQKRRLVSGADPDAFATPEAWQQAAADAGLDPTQISRDMQYPRVVSFSKEKDLEALAKWDRKNEVRAAAADLLGQDFTPGKAPSPATRVAERTEKSITQNMEPVGDGWFVKQEPDNGMFIMAKKYDGLLGQASPADKWLLFKTDRPGRFVKKSDLYGKAQVNREKWIVGESTIESAVKEPGLLQDIDNFMKTLPYERYIQASHMTGGPEGVSKYLDKVTPKGVKNSVIGEQLNNIVREYLAPAARQLRKSTRGNYTLSMGRAIQDAADTFIQKVMQGELKLDPKGSVWRQLTLASEQGGRSVQAVIEDLDKEGLLNEFIHLWRNEISPKMAREMAAQGKIQMRTAELAGELDGMTGKVLQAVNQFQKAAGKDVTKFRQGHYGLTRTWEGDHFHTLKDEGGRVVGMAASATRKGAQVKAQELAGRLSQELGRPIRIGEAFTRGQLDSVPAPLRPYVTNPGFTLERANVRGFAFDDKVPTKEELLKAYQNSLGKRATYLGNLGREALLSRHVAALSVEDPFAYRVVSTRFNQMSGVEGEFSRVQNKLADKVLSPFLGANSASKIVRATNTGLMHLQLGFMKLSYPITNVIGTLQVVAPELAFVMNAAPETVNGAYHMAIPAMGSRGTVGMMGVLNPMKIMGQAMKETYKPSKAMLTGLERAVNERVIDARLVEEYVGQNRTQLRNFKGAIKGPKEFLNYVMAWSEFMPATSERLARVLSFNAGWIAGRDIMRISDEDALYRFAKQFVERTNYLYSSSDRPLVFTSPLGSSMGLFKNWMMNYMAATVEYANMGLSQNVWSPLVWQTMGTFAVGGAAATPIYWAANGASNILAQKDLMQWAYDDFSGQTADGLMFGLPAALSGVSLSSQMTAPGANPVRDASQLFSFAVWDRAKNLGGAAQAAIDNWQTTGTHPGSDPDVRNQLIKAFAPVNLYRYFATQEEGLVKNLATDLPTARGLSWLDIQLYRMGLQPVEMERQLKVADEMYKSREANKAAVQRYGDAFRDAMTAGDNRAMDLILQRAMIDGLDISRVLKSAQTRERLAGKTTSERMGNPAKLLEWQNVLQPQ